MQDPTATISPGEQSQRTTLALSMDEFAALEERVVRAVSLVRRERQARVAAEERANELESKLQLQAPAMQLLETELAALRAERDQMRGRVERILNQLDSLEL